MILIVLGDPRLQGLNVTVENHKLWLYELYGNYTFCDFRHLTLATIRRELSAILNGTPDDVFILVNCHGITDSVTGQEYLILGSDCRRWEDRDFSRILHANTMKHVSVWLECCHSGGMFEYDETLDMEHVNEPLGEDTDGNWLYRHVTKTGYDRIRTNVMFMCACGREEQCYQNAKSGAISTYLLRQLSLNPYRYKPDTVTLLLNQRLGHVQHAQIKSVYAKHLWGSLNYRNKLNSN